MTTTDEGMAVERAQLEGLRRSLGAHLAVYRTAAGVSQPELGQALGRTRSMVSKVEHGTRTMPVALWELADELCGAKGALVDEYTTLEQAEATYRDQRRARRRAAQQAVAHAQAQALAASLSPASTSSDVLGRNGGGKWPEGGGLVNEGLAEELLSVVAKLVRLLGRRDAIRLLGSVLTAVGLPGLDLDPDEHVRIAQAVAVPNRVDAQVVNNLAATLTHCKRLEDTLGPCRVLDPIKAQHRLVGHLLTGNRPDKLVKPLRLVQSTIASTVGTCLVNMGQLEEASRYFAQARKSGHDAGNPASAAYAAANASFAAFLRSDTPTALDTAAAARSLAARTDDARLKALAEQMAAAAYSLDGQYGRCMSALARAHDVLADTSGCVPSESPAYWVHHGTLDSQRSTFLCLLGKPKQAVEAASNARDRFNRNFVGSWGRCQVRLAHALVLDKEITEAARILADAADLAHLGPRLTQELHTVRALMNPWQHTPTVKTLDEQLHTCGLYSL